MLVLLLLPHLLRAPSGVAEGRTYRSYFTCFRYFVRTFPVPFPDLPGDSFLRHSSGSDRVGFLMLTSVTKIDFDDLTEAIPAFIAIIAMPFLYSISEGIALGVISYVIINVCTGKAKDKKISPLMYALAVIFVLKYVFL